MTAPYTGSQGEKPIFEECGKIFDFVGGNTTYNEFYYVVYIHKNFTIRDKKIAQKTLKKLKKMIEYN